MITITSVWYFLFVLIFLMLYYLLPHRFQWQVLLLASIVFFGLVGTPWTIVYLILAVLVTWYAGKRIRELREHQENDLNAKKWLILALVVDIGMLAILKYVNFLLLNLGRTYQILFHQSGIDWTVDWPAALGISFYTLQIVGYLLDCYWNISKPQESISKFALFTCFFPQMVSGPISRYEQLKQEIYDEHSFDWNNIRNGSIRIAVGMFKKIGLADNLACCVPFMFETYTGPVQVLTILAYVVWIYADFSGCMDIVIGTAQCFGITMVENFRSPFRSRSIREFWQRWHITLGLWLRDYVMYPLLRTKLWKKMTKALKRNGHKRASKLIPTHLAMLVLWLCMGLWHGGGWNFILEGIWFWLVIVIGEWMSPISNKITGKINTDGSLWILFQRMRTLIIYAIGAVMFWSNSVTILPDFFSNIFVFHSLSDLKADLSCLINSPDSFAAFLNAIVCFVIFLIIRFVEHKYGSISNAMKGKIVVFQIFIVFLMLYILIFCGVYGPGYSTAEFIYGGF